MRKLLGIGLLFCILADLQAGELKQPPRLIEGKLKNGLTYYIYPNAYPKGEAVYRLFIKSGSVYEEEDQRGLAHFLEHMAFNGTRHFPGNSLVRFLETKGAKFGKDLNAHTAMNETVYKLQLPSYTAGMVDTTLTILADWAGGLLLDSLEIEEERGVILSEGLSKTGPQQEVQNAFLMELLNHSRYASRLTIGDTAIIRHFPHERIKAYYRDWYHPSLMAVAVVGDVNPAQVEKGIREKFSHLEKAVKKQPVTYGIENYKERKLKTVVHESLEKISLQMIQLMPRDKAVEQEKDYPLWLRRNLLNRLLKARFNALSFENPSYASGSISVSDFMNVKGVLFASVELVPGRLQEGICDFATDAEQIFRYGFTAREIEKVQKKYVSEIRRKAESEMPVRSVSLMEEIYNRFYRGDQIITPAEEYRLLKKYIGQMDSLAFVRELQRLRIPEQTHYLLTAFEKAREQLPEEGQLFTWLDQIRRQEVRPYQNDVTVPETLLPVLPVAGKVVQQKHLAAIQADLLELSNGVRVVYRPAVTRGGKIQLSGFRQGGYYALDSADYVNGMFASSVIPLCGAGAFSREALSQFLAGNSSAVRFLIDKTRTGVAASADERNKETLFQLLYLKWTQPRMDTSVFRQTRDKTIESYRTANRTEADRYYRDLKMLLQGNSYVNREITDTVVLEEVEAERLLPVFQACFGPAGGYTFVIIADTPLEELMPYICTYLGGLPSGKAATAYVYPGAQIPQQSADFIRQAGDAPKAQVSLVFQQDRLPESLRLYNLKSDLLKAVIRMKLLKELREELGMIYSVSVSASATRHPAALSRQMISFSCEPANAAYLMERTGQRLKMMQEHPEEWQAELEDVKTNLIKEMKLNLQKDSFWAGFIRNSLFNQEEDWNYLQDYEHIVKAIPAEEIAAMIGQCMVEGPCIKAVLYPKEKE